MYDDRDSVGVHEVAEARDAAVVGRIAVFSGTVLGSITTPLARSNR